MFGVWLACRAGGRVEAWDGSFAVVRSRLASPYNSRVQPIEPAPFGSAGSFGSILVPISAAEAPGR
jgi:hypothetical protein